jgi:hypothetical protein
MSKSRYEQVYDNEWFEAPRSGTLIACCDCGLVHDVRTKSVGRKIFLRFERKDRNTSALRRFTRKAEEIKK